MNTDTTMQQIDRMGAPKRLHSQTNKQTDTKFKENPTETNNSEGSLVLRAIKQNTTQKNQTNREHTKNTNTKALKNMRFGCVTSAHTSPLLRVLFIGHCFKFVQFVLWGRIPHQPASHRLVFVCIESALARDIHFKHLVARCRTSYRSVATTVPSRPCRIFTNISLRNHNA